MAPEKTPTTMTASTEDAKTNNPKNSNNMDDTDFSESGDLTGDGGVVKEILKHGQQGWMKPENGDEVYMHYRGTLASDGSEFDSSYARDKPFSFKLGEGSVIKGWDIVGKTMARGEKARVTLSAAYAYGESGSSPKIPKNATLVFEMELISWTSQRDIFGDQLVMKSEITSGDGWERPGKMAEVEVAVTINQIDAENHHKVVKHLYTNESLVITLNDEKHVPEAWNKVIPDMKKNGVLYLTCRGSRIHDDGILNYLDVDLSNEADLKCVRHQLTLKSWKKIEDVNGNGTVMKKVLKEGEGWEKPSEGSVTTINLKMWKYDQSSNLLVPPPSKDCTAPIYEAKEFSFKAGDGIVIDGIDAVVQSMKLEEHCMTFIQSQLGFASAKNLLTDELKGKGIKEDDKLLIEVELLKVDKAKDVWSMSYEEKIEEMKVRKKRGNELFKDQRYETARKSYDRAINFFDSSTSDLNPDIKTQVNELLVSCHLNLAMCHDRMGDMAKVLNHCKKALEIQPSNVKALYRQGSAYLALDDFYNAQSALKYAKELSPGNVDVLKKLRELKNKRLKQDAQDKKLFSNLFGRMSKMEEKEGVKPEEPKEEEGGCSKGCCGGAAPPSEVVEEVDATANGSNMDES